MFRYIARTVQEGHPTLLEGATLYFLFSDSFPGGLLLKNIGAIFRMLYEDVTISAYMLDSAGLSDIERNEYVVIFLGSMKMENWKSFRMLARTNDYSRAFSAPSLVAAAVAEFAL